MKYLPLILIALIFAGCGETKSEPENPPFTAEHLMNKYNVEGCLALYDLNDDSLMVYNQDLFVERHTPASTFKMLHTLIGLEIGVITDEKFEIKWDGVIRKPSDLNQQLTVKMAYDMSAVWYYQEVARRIGEPRLKYWLDKVGYGNRSTGGMVDTFWLNGNLTISAEEQLDFIIRLNKNELPFQSSTLEVARKIMTIDKQTGYRVIGKTGWGIQGDMNVGWFVGYLTTNDDNVAFVCMIKSNKEDPVDFAKARKEIVYEALREQGYLSTPS